MVATRTAGQQCLVIGGAGFLGRHLVDALVEKYQVSTFDVRESGDPSAKAIIGDIRNADDVKKACRGMDVVFHCASIAPDGSADPSIKKLAYGVNVLGTRNVIQACQTYRVPKLVFTSSASVVYDGKDLNNVDERAPYAHKAMDYYTETKIEAEKLVLAANGVQGLATVALRPSGIFGEWDKLFVPALIEKAKQGKSKFIVGNGRNMMEFTYAGNVADAHVLAAEKLSLDSHIAGQAYFITNDEPVLFWGFLGDVVEGLGYDRPRIKLPWLPLFLLALFLEWCVVPLLKPFVKLELGNFSSSRMRIAAATRRLSCEKAKQELGYKPKVTIEAGLKRTIAHFQPYAKGKEYKKVH